MKALSETSVKLFGLMCRQGFPEEFCTLITQELNTDYTAKRMIGYLRQVKHASPEDVADEMLAILSDREAYVRKKCAEHTQAKWNRYMELGMADGPEDP